MPRRSKEEMALDDMTKEMKATLWTFISNLPPEYALRLLNAIGIYCMTQRLRILKRMNKEET
jgi:hypothetical protein